MTSLDFSPSSYCDEKRTDRINRMVQDLQDLFKMLNLAYGIRIPDIPLGSLCIRKAHINILSIL
jgi:hypothetical protein